jgi:hypothetical protein
VQEARPQLRIPCSVSRVPSLTPDTWHLLPSLAHPQTPFSARRAPTPCRQHLSLRERRHSARPALRPCGSSIVTRIGRCGEGTVLGPVGLYRRQWGLGLSCLRRHQNPRRWKSRRAGVRALRYPGPEPRISNP